jgi:hypothetical protein
MATVYEHRKADLFEKFLPMVVPAAVNDNIHCGNMVVYIEYMISPNMAAGTGGNSSLLPSNGTCMIRQTASSYSHRVVRDQYQYGCWYRWEQHPATIKRHLCDQTNCIKLQSQGGT